MADEQNLEKEKDLSANTFPVVGVGASAGGLDAFKKLIKSIPENSGMAFILVQHLEPSHDSMLVEILQKITPIPVFEIVNNLRVESNHIYIIPSNKLLTANDGVLQLGPRLLNEKNMPIDIFFSSLAEVHQSHAIGVVLSGNATDGTRGLKTIKDHGGITFAQSPDSAAFHGMPQNAIDAEVVDFILRPEDIPKELVKLNETFKKGLETEEIDSAQAKEDHFRQILSLMRIRKGVDFTYYKQTTIRRRILRRMSLNKIEKIADYLNYLRENKLEQDILFNDLLIPVTEFFRDHKTFEKLCETLFPLLLKKNEPVSLRIWVAGCSTGEEPYSMGMCLHEYLDGKLEDYKIQIFATDISEKSISKARAGIYSKREVNNMSEIRLQKYFTKIEGNFQIDKNIRDMCVFATHNFLKDPPFTKMDFISCRNVLIYMEPFLQKKALNTFHYSLKEKGYLLLGVSETASPASELFVHAGKNLKLYQRKTVPARFIHVTSERNEAIFKNIPVSHQKENIQEDFKKSADDVLLSKFTPPGVIVDDQMNIVQFRGFTGAWLEPPPGKPTLHVLKMAREGLAFELRNALHKAKASNSICAKEAIPFNLLGEQKSVSVQVIPLLNTSEPHFLILFKDDGPNPEIANMLANSRTLDSQQTFESLQIQRLQDELAQVREDMRTITEDQEAVNEELQSANEELLSGSEELQSLNEELETSKEEIQSTNEELVILNQELFDRNEQLNLSRLYAESIVATIREPLIILDNKLHIRTANKSYFEKFNTSEVETEHKSFFQIGSGQWNIPSLREMLDSILIDGKTVTDFTIIQTFQWIGERIFQLNATMIVRKDNSEKLVLLAFEDVTERRKLQNDLELFAHELEKKVNERTSELKNANASLKHSNENLEQFAFIASHDLQEPLRKIMTFANILTKRYGSDIPENIKGLLEKISFSAVRMSMLIKEVLSFSKVMNPEVAFEKTDLDLILKNVISDFDLLIEQKNATIDAEQLPFIDAIPIQINQLFYNLLSNALKFAGPDSPGIHISSSMIKRDELVKYPTLDEHYPHCEIIFRDNGIGFDQQFAKQVFMIFQRLNSHDFEGTGIGLALCKKIVTNHHGEIFAESKKGVGTTFHIILPMEQRIVTN